MTKKVLALALALCMIFALCACGASSSAPATSNAAPASGGETAPAAAAPADSQQQVILKFGHNSAETHPYQFGAMKIKELAEEYSNGTLSLDVYPNAQLGSEEEMLQGMILGSVDMAGIAPASFTVFNDSFSVFQIPFLLVSNEHVDAALRDGEAGDYLEGLAEEGGVKILSWCESGFRQTMNNKREVRSPEDLVGLKMRVPGWTIYIDIYETIGAVVTSMPWNEVYMAAQQGVIDGFESPMGTLTGNSMYEVANYLSMDNHIYTADCKCISMQTYNALSDEHKAAIEQAAYEGGEYQRELIRENEKSDYLQIMIDNDINIVMPEEIDMAAWQNSSSYVFEEFADSIDLKAVELIQAVQP